MKRTCYMLATILIINLIPYSVFADKDETSDKIFEKSEFIELYTSIYDSVMDILNSSMKDTEKEEKLENLFNKYKLNEDETELPKFLIDIGSYKHRERLMHIITDELVNTIEIKIEDICFKEKNPTNRINKIEDLLKFYKLDDEISKYEIMKLDNRFDSIDIYEQISDIIEKYNVKKQLAFSINNVVDRIDNSQDYDHIKTILDKYLMAQKLDALIDSNDLVKIIKKTKDNDKRVKLLFDEIIIKKNEQYFKERVENIAYEIIDELDYNKYYNCVDSIITILKNNGIGYDWDLEEGILNVFEYADQGYKTKQEAIQSEIFTKLKFSYSKEEINSTLEEIVSILEAVVEDENNYKRVSRENSDEIYEEFLDIVYEYKIKDIKQYVIPEDIAYVYYEYEDLGYDTALEAIVNHLREVLNKSELDDSILKIVEESQYSLPVIIENLTIYLNNESEYEEYLDTPKITEIINSKPENMDTIIVNLILDGIIESKKEDIIWFIDFMDELSNPGYRDKEIRIADILDDNMLYPLVDEDEIMDIYAEYNDSDISLKQELYDKLFKKLVLPKTNIENTIKNSIIRIIEKKDFMSNQDLEHEIDNSLMFSGLNTYVIQNDIKNAYIFPLKYGYSDRESGIIKIIKGGMNEKISSEIQEIFNKNLNEKETEKEIRIILKKNYLHCNMSFSEIKAKYLQQN
ncbi:hypothetical protein [Dethiothermospora halolimnae]|uniref:hypothetical protein n=1 Tax=Dethiothermospora halolimnae TaxID=3114390 RepID=UPI003CCBE197